MKTESKLCNWILKFEHTDNFAMCELEENHTENHKALMFEWDEGVTEAHSSYRLRGLNLLKMRMKNLIEGEEK